MANNCDYSIKVVSKKKTSIKRFVNIMNNADKEFCLYRVFDAIVDMEHDLHRENKLFSLEFVGDVANGCAMLVYANEEDDDKSLNDPRLTNLPKICKLLKIGVEIWSVEPNIGFQEHYIINSNGKIVEEECVDWGCECDDDGNVLREFGGFKDYLEFADDLDIYGQVKEGAVI